MAKIYLEGYGDPAVAEYFLREKGIVLDPPEKLVSLLQPSTSPEILVATMGYLSRLPDPVPQALEPARSFIFAGTKSAIRSSALELAGSILKEKGADLYLEALADRRFDSKQAAVWFLCKYGDERALPHLLKRFQPLSPGRGRTPGLIRPEERERTWILGYLHNYRDRPEVIKKFQKLIDHWDDLELNEIEWICSHLEYFNLPELRIKSD